MKLTIVTTTYNQEKYIGKAIEGMLMQKTEFPFEIVISNDCSTDKTLDVIKKYQDANPGKIRIIDNPKNLGAMDNFINTLNQIKDTEYVALCDGDDFWTDENKLQKQVDFLDKNKEFSICFHKTKLFYEDGSKEDEILPDKCKEVSTINDLVEGNYIVANSVVYRWRFNNEDLKSIFPNNIVPGDYYVHLLHAEKGKIKMIDEVMSSYRRHSEGMWWSNAAEDKSEFIIKYGKKFLNFYNAADKNIKLPENAFAAQRKDIVYNIIVTYVKNGLNEELKTAFESDKDKEVAKVCQNEIVSRNVWFLDYLASGEIERTKNLETLLLEKNKQIEAFENSRYWKIRKKIKKIFSFRKK